MPNKRWGFIVVTAQSMSRVRQVYVSGILLVFLCTIFVTGIVGMAKLVSFSSSYAHAKFGVYEAKRENRGLMMKIKFLNKFISQETDKINHLVAFEDKIRLQYGMDRISTEVRRAGVGGRPTREDILLTHLLDPVLMHAEAVRESLEVLLRKADLQDSTLTRVTHNVTRIHKKWSQRPSTWPTQGRITSYFGYRFHPILGHTLFHDGLDIANKVWTPIYATADGIVKSSGMKDYYGRLVCIDHPESDCQTLYGHLHQSVVVAGQVVKRGDLIGYMGNTGRSTGSHVHYEVRVKKKPVNPLSYILPTDAIID
jgi:hypothetical protein